MQQVLIHQKAKIKNIEYRIPDVTNLATNTSLMLK